MSLNVGFYLNYNYNVERIYFLINGRIIKVL